MSKQIVERLEDAGVKARLVPVSALLKVKEEYRKIDRSSLLWNEYYSSLKLDVPEGMEAARSILIAAAPSSAVRVTFYVGENNRSFLIPPTYMPRHWKSIKERVEKAVEGHETWKAYLPKKLLAVMSGLASYGRNNITYVRGLGSYIRLQAYLTTAGPESGIRGIEHETMCGSCAACVSACPTGAITKESFKINAERCITMYNERDGAFPEWIPEGAHNCIVGCMRCQLCCPINKGRLKTEKGPVFDETETRLILSGTEFERLPEKTGKKFKDIEYGSGYNSFVRNVRALLENGGIKDNKDVS
jgi:epoxyqueuosine reductase